MLICNLPSKYVDEQEYPHVYTAQSDEEVQAFTCTRDLLRRQREGYGTYGGPKKVMNCPYAKCKRHSGKGFSRAENLREHLRRMHPRNAARHQPCVTQVEELSLGCTQEHYAREEKRNHNVIGLNGKVYYFSTGSPRSSGTSKALGLEEPDPQRSGSLLSGFHRLLVHTANVLTLVNTHCSSRSGDLDVLPCFRRPLFVMDFVDRAKVFAECVRSIFTWKSVPRLLHWSAIANIHLEPSFASCSASSSTIARSNGGHWPLPEDWIVRGLLWTEKLFPVDWFSNDNDEDKTSLEFPSMTKDRAERVLWLGNNLASHERWIVYDDQTNRFSLLDSPDEEEENHIPVSRYGLGGFHGTRIDSIGQRAAVGKSVLSALASNLATKISTRHLMARF